MSTECDLHQNPETKPGVAPVGARAQAFLSFNDEQKLMTRYLLDSEGKFRMRHPFVVEAIWDLVKDKVLPRLKQYDEECGADGTKCDKNK